MTRGFLWLIDDAMLRITQNRSAAQVTQATKIALGGLTPCRSPRRLHWNLVDRVVRMAMEQFVTITGTQRVEIELVDEAVC